MINEIGDITWGTEGLWKQFARWFEMDPESVAVFDGESPIKRIDIYRNALVLADQLLQAGIGAGHRILFDSHTSVDTVVIGLALSKLGAIICPVNYKLANKERQLILERLRPTAYLSHRKEKAAVELVGLKNMYLYLQSSPIVESTSEEETVLIGFTSGTTGVPKAVPHTASSLNYASKYCSSIVGLRQGEPIMAISPLTSAAGWTFNVHIALSMGHPLILMGEWNPLKALELMDLHKSAWGMCVPTHLLLMMEAVHSGQWTRHLPSMRALSVGGSPNSVDIVINANKLLGIQVLRMYGMSECLGHASVRLTDLEERKLIFDGVPFPGTHLEAYDSKGKSLPRGEIGEAGVRGPSLFKGYLPGLGAEQNKRTSDDAFLTGDLIIRDEEGFIRVVGRIKDQIIRGGFKIDAAEVETALMTHPAIVEAAVVSRPDKLLGERICAVVSVRANHELILDDICSCLKEIGISKAKWPEFLFIVPSLPKTDFGKVDKNRVREIVLKEDQTHA
ncbi:class I adenylate-forming enzyme family protein [Peribacillus sp. NPDC046944]|uniref:class I adenylate-forming enzyme family protein n=1 Tax=unclassified Peribacillus TaxID=2675266 RepID=UPI0038163F04